VGFNRLESECGGLRFDRREAPITRRFVHEGAQVKSEGAAVKFPG
jgi:hypothetical protein